MRFNSEIYDRDKSLTSRSRLPTSLDHLPTYPYSTARSITPYDATDPSLLDPFLLSRLHFEEFLRGQSAMFYQVMAEREKALSVKSDSCAESSARERFERDRPESSQSETQLKCERDRSDRNRSKLNDIVSGYETFGSGSSDYNSYLPRLFDNSSRDTSKETISSKDTTNSRDMVAPFSNGKSIIRTTSLTELEQLVDSCIMPDEGLGETEPPLTVRDQKSFQAEPRQRKTISPHDFDDKSQMLLGGVLSLPHASKFEGESDVVPTNGHYDADDSESESISSKKEHKSSRFSFKKAKPKAKSKCEKELAT